MPECWSTTKIQQSRVRWGNCLAVSERGCLVIGKSFKWCGCRLFVCFLICFCHEGGRRVRPVGAWWRPRVLGWVRWVAPECPASVCPCPWARTSPSLPGAGFSEGLSKHIPLGGEGIGWVGVGVYECDNASVLMRLLKHGENIPFGGIYIFEILTCRACSCSCVRLPLMLILSTMMFFNFLKSQICSDTVLRTNPIKSRPWPLSHCNHVVLAEVTFLNVNDSL